MLDRGEDPDLLENYPRFSFTILYEHVVESFRKLVLDNRLEIESLVSTNNAKSSEVGMSAVHRSSTLKLA